MCQRACRKLLLLPACGEKVGMRGRFHESKPSMLRRVERPPHPDLLPASGARESSELAANPSLPNRVPVRQARACEGWYESTGSRPIVSIHAIAFRLPEGEIGRASCRERV